MAISSTIIILLSIMGAILKFFQTVLINNKHQATMLTTISLFNHV